MYCKHCGNETNENSKFCKHCGKTINTQTEKTQKNDNSFKAEIKENVSKNEPVK